MRFCTFEIVTLKEEADEGYAAYSPSLPGCFSNGRTVEETKRDMREAIRQRVAALLVHMEPRVTAGGSQSRSPASMSRSISSTTPRNAGR